MADYARVLAAIDQLLGTDGLGRYAEQARTMAEDSLSSDSFLARLHEMQIDFTGKAAELLAKAKPDTDGWRPPRDWPKDPRAVTSLLKRNAPALRKAGWVVEDEPDRHAHSTTWTVRHPEKVRNQYSQGSQYSQDPQNSQEIGRKSDSQYSQDSQSAKSGDALTSATSATSATGGTDPFDFQAALSAASSHPASSDQCQLCGNPLVWPDAQQRGICTTCWLHDDDGAA